MNIIKEELVTDAEAKETLIAREKQAELKLVQKNAFEILKKFIKVDNEKIKKIVEELKNMPELRDRQITAIANFLPEDKDDLRAVLHKDYTSISPENVDKILEIVKKNI